MMCLFNFFNLQRLLDLTNKIISSRDIYKQGIITLITGRTVDGTRNTDDHKAIRAVKLKKQQLLFTLNTI